MMPVVMEERSEREMEQGERERRQREEGRERVE